MVILLEQWLTVLAHELLVDAPPDPPRKLADVFSQLRVLCSRLLLLVHRHRCLLLLQVSPQLGNTVLLLLVRLPELVLELLHLRIKDASGLIVLLEELLVRHRLLAQFPDVPLLLPLGGGERLVDVKVVFVRELPITLRLRLSGDLSELQLLLFLYGQLVDVSLGLHPLELVRVFELQIGLHERQTNQAGVLLKVPPHVGLLDVGQVELTIFVEARTVLPDLLEEGLGFALQLSRRRGGHRGCPMQIVCRLGSAERTTHRCRAR